MKTRELERAREWEKGGGGREEGRREITHILLAEKVSLESRDVLDGTELILNILKALCKSYLLQSDRQRLGMTPEIFSSYSLLW